MAGRVNVRCKVIDGPGFGLADNDATVDGGVVAIDDQAG